MSAKRLITISVVSLIAFSSLASLAQAQNMLQNAGFEKGSEGWIFSKGRESTDVTCGFAISNDAPHSGAASAKFTAAEFARFGIAPVENVLPAQIPAKVGNRFRISYWIRAGEDGEASADGPGFLVRVVYLKGGQPTKNSLTDYVGLNGTVLRHSPKDPDWSGLSAPLPTEWTKVEAVIEVPDVDGGIDAISPPVFYGWSLRGSVFLDDVSFERVGQDVAPSPVLE